MGHPPMKRCMSIQLVTTSAISPRKLLTKLSVSVFAILSFLLLIPSAAIAPHRRVSQLFLLSPDLRPGLSYAAPPELGR